MEQEIAKWIHELSLLSERQILAGVFVLFLQGAVISIFPEEVLMMAVGILCYQGKVHFPAAVLAVLLGLLPANAFMVGVGRYLGNRVLKIWPLSMVAQSRITDLLLRPIKRYPRRMTFMTRFVPWVRGPVYFSLGYTKFPVHKFSLVDGTAACIHVPLVVFLGSRLAKSSSSVFEAFQKLGLIMLGFIGLGVAISFIMKRRKVKV